MAAAGRSLPQASRRFFRHEDDVFKARGQRHINLRHKRVLEPLFRHRPQDARRADDGNAALDAEHGIQRLLCKLDARRDADCHGKIELCHQGGPIHVWWRAIPPNSRAAASFPADVNAKLPRQYARNELSRPGIDGRLANGNLEARLRHMPDALARTEHEPLPRRAFLERRENRSAIRDVRVVARKLHDFSRRAARALDTLASFGRPDCLDGNLQHRAVKRLDLECRTLLAPQKFQSGQRPGRRTSARRIAAA